MSGTFSPFRSLTESATVAGTADFLNGYTYDGLSRLTQVTQQGQTGGNSVAVKNVFLSYNGVGQYATISRYAQPSRPGCSANGSRYGSSGRHPRG